MTTTKQTSSSDIIITLDNIHKCTTYQLRQELMQRNHFTKDYNGTINYTILLQKLVSILRQEKEDRESQRLKEILLLRNNINQTATGERRSCGEEIISLKEQLEIKKAERKMAALERSRKRKENVTYFHSKKEFNQQLLMAANENDENSGGTAEKTSSHSLKESRNMIDENFLDDGSAVGNTIDSQNPFAPKFKAKIGGKCV